MEIQRKVRHLVKIPLEETTKSLEKPVFHRLVELGEKSWDQGLPEGMVEEALVNPPIL